MKKILAILLALTIACCGFAGAASAADAEELTVFWWGNQVRNERTQAVLDMFTAEKENLSIDGQFASGAEYFTRLATLAAGHNIPDVLQMDYGYLSQYIDNGLLLNLSPYIEDGSLDVTNVSPSVLDTGAKDGEVYAICIGVAAPGLLYNKTLLDEAGITIHDNMTLDEFKDVCREVYEKTGYKTSLAYGADSPRDYVQYLLRAYDKDLFGDKQFGVESSADFLEYFSLVEEGIKEGWHIDPAIYVEHQAASIEQDCLVYGSSPDTMSWCGFYWSNQLTAAQNVAPEGVEIGVTTWPSAVPAKSNYLKPSQFFCVSAETKDPAMSVEIVDYFTNSVEANNVLLGERGVPISSVVANAISEKLTEKECEFVSYINDVVTPNCTKISPPAPVESAQIQDLVKLLTENVMYGKMTAQEAADAFFTQGNEILAGN